MTRVFLSHSTKDMEKVRSLAKELEKRGIEVWFAPDALQSGQDWAAKVAEGLDSCDATVVALSVSALELKWVRREVKIAFESGKKVYPVHLLKVALAKELALFIDQRRRVDFFEKTKDTQLDELASAIKTGVDLQERRSRREHRALRAGIAAFIAVLTCVGLALFWYLDRVGGSLVDETAFTDPYPDLFAELWRSGDGKYALSELEHTSLYLHNAGPQQQPVEIQFRTPDGRLVSRALDRGKVQEDSLQIELLVLPAGNTLDVCIALEVSDGTRQALLKTVSGASDYDTTRRFVELRDQDTCDDAFGSPPKAEDKKAWQDAIRAARFEDDNTFVVIDSIGATVAGRLEHQLNFGFHGGYEAGRRIPRKFDVVIETSPDGTVWNNGVIEGGGKFQYRIPYRRPLDEVVRICATTFFADDLVVLHERLFERTGDGGAFQSFEVIGPQLSDDITACRKSRSPDGHDISPAAPLTLMDRVLPPIGDPPAELPRPDAIARLNSGQPAPYGPALGGMRLGMDFAEAENAANTLMPHASLKETPLPAEMMARYGLAFEGKTVRLEDKQTGQLLVLTRRDLDSNTSVLAGIFYFITGLQEIPRRADFLTAAKDRFGADQLRGVETFSNAIRQYFAASDDRRCRWIGLSQSSGIGLDYINQGPCGLEVYIDFNDHQQGRGAFQNEIGIFDFQAMGMQLE